ncbi:DUF6455 family protein [Yoonia sp. F2084L]|uniref:DUF6455 family protein n=1 Tax=Yoonia sp. F2084L TaxID=2926419 RepID=UPI001FF2E415|nr:DUF6455 family protein [Yoonia sp. F2084L]MCK0095493.1 DUF6455 family protein [Yoonia sp. F2084L]
MQTLGDPREHFWRVIKMAKACEVDLSTALDDGQINVADWADMITGCRGCTEVDRCDRLMRQEEHVARAPEYCVNRETFAELRQA